MRSPSKLHYEYLDDGLYCQNMHMAVEKSGQRYAVADSRENALEIIRLVNEFRATAITSQKEQQ